MIKATDSSQQNLLPSTNLQTNQSEQKDFSMFENQHSEMIRPQNLSSQEQSVHQQSTFQTFEDQKSIQNSADFLQRQNNRIQETEMIMNQQQKNNCETHQQHQYISNMQSQVMKPPSMPIENLTHGQYTKNQVQQQIMYQNFASQPQYQAGQQSFTGQQQQTHQYGPVGPYMMNQQQFVQYPTQACQQQNLPQYSAFMAHQAAQIVENRRQQQIAEQSARFGLPPHLISAGVMQTKTYRTGHLLQLLTQKGDTLPNANQVITLFHSEAPPDIRILDYFIRVFLSAGLHDEQAPVIFVLMDRLCEKAAKKNIPLVINSLIVHRVILCIVLLTSKFYNDIYYQNKYIADEGGVPLEELNLLERHFLETIDYQLVVTEDQLSGIDRVITEMFSTSTQQDGTVSPFQSPPGSLSSSPVIPAQQPAVSNSYQQQQALLMQQQQILQQQQVPNQNLQFGEQHQISQQMKNQFLNQQIQGQQQFIQQPHPGMYNMNYHHQIQNQPQENQPNFQPQMNVNHPQTMQRQQQVNNQFNQPMQADPFHLERNQNFQPPIFRSVDKMIQRPNQMNFFAPNSQVGTTYQNRRFSGSQCQVSEPQYSQQHTQPQISKEITQNTFDQEEKTDPYVDVGISRQIYRSTEQTEPAEESGLDMSKPLSEEQEDGIENIILHFEESSPEGGYQKKE